MFRWSDYLDMGEVHMWNTDLTLSDCVRFTLCEVYICFLLTGVDREMCVVCLHLAVCVCVCVCMRRCVCACVCVFKVRKLQQVQIYTATVKN